MRTILKSSSGVLLAALLLAWTTFCGVGLVAHCDGGPPHSCEGTALPAMLDDHDDHHGDGDLPDCGCPADHQHTAVSPEMILLAAPKGLTPRWVECVICPQPPARTLPADHSQKPAIIQEPVPPAASPPHLTCGPLLI